MRNDCGVNNGADTEDSQLVELAKAGDLDAFGALVRRHQPLALRVAYALVGDEAEDVVQDALVKAYRSLAGFHAGGPFRAWLLRIVTNEASNRRRSTARRRQLALRVRERDVAQAADADVLDRARAGVLAAAVAKLDVPHRQVIALRFFAELSEAEMAVTLDCAPGTVKSRLSRALERLRAELPLEELR